MFEGLHELKKEDIPNYICELFAFRVPENRNLGWVDRSKITLRVNIPSVDADLVIKQLPSGLSGSQLSSTGFVCWLTCVVLADWLASQESQFYALCASPITVLELGCGTSALLASVLGPRVRHYVATDQKHILKLAIGNFQENAVGRYTSSTVDSPHRLGGKVDFIELDWEDNENGFRMFTELTGSQWPDLVVASDTIYNEYLAGAFVETLKRAMSNSLVGLIAVHLRDEPLMQFFLDSLCKAFQVFTIPEERLGELRHGYDVYCIKV